MKTFRFLLALAFASAGFALTAHAGDGKDCGSCCGDKAQKKDEKKPETKA